MGLTRHQVRPILYDGPASLTSALVNAVDEAKLINQSVIGAYSVNGRPTKRISSNIRQE